MNSKSNNKEIAIYWDYENVALPKWCGAAEAAKQIYNAVSKYGRVVERRLYFDYQKHSATLTGPHDCSGLDLSGFDLVNTPTRNSKETLDKKLIADVLTFAWDCTARNTELKPCVVLITSDGDYAYTLAKLRDRGVMNIVMYGKDCSVAQILVENADVSLSFERDVLSEQTVAVISAKPAMEETSRSSSLFFKYIPDLKDVREFVEFIERGFNAHVQRALMFRLPDGSTSFAHIQFTNPHDGTRILNVARSGEGISFRGRNLVADFDTKIPDEGSMSRASSDCCYKRQDRQPNQPSACPRRVIPPSRPNQPARAQHRPAPAVDYVGTQKDITKCIVCLYNEQVSRTMAPLASTQECEKCWAAASPFNGSFHRVYSSLPKSEATVRIRSTLEKSITEGFITVARRKLDSGAFLGVRWHQNRGLRDDLSREPYLRLTLKGRTHVQEFFQKKKTDDFLRPRAQANPSAGEFGSCLSSGTFLSCSNLPSATNVQELVDFLETDHHAHVERALIFPCMEYTDDQNGGTHIADCDKYAAYVQLTNAKFGLAFNILALTIGISFNGVQLIAALPSAASFEKKISTSRENDCYYKPESAAELSQKILAMPADAKKHHVHAIERGFCSHMFKEQKIIGNEEQLPCDQCWVNYSTVGTSIRSSATFCDLSAFDCRQLLKLTRDITIYDGLIEIGRRKLGGNRGYVSIPWLEDRGESKSLSKEIYLRLTDAGMSLFYNTKLPQQKDPSSVFLKDPPPAEPEIESDPMLSEALGPNEANESTDTEVEEKSPTVFSELVSNTDVVSGSSNGCVALSHCKDGNNQLFDCDMAATNIDSSHQQQILATQPEIESNLPSECNFLVTNIDQEEQQQNLDTAITAQDSGEAKEANQPHPQSLTYRANRTCPVAFSGEVTNHSAHLAAALDPSTSMDGPNSTLHQPQPKSDMWVDPTRPWPRGTTPTPSYATNTTRKGGASWPQGQEKIPPHPPNNQHEGGAAALQKDGDATLQT